MTYLDFSKAACRTSHPGVFFPNQGESTAPAKAICDGCPIQAECLEHAVVNKERFGVWGGTSEKERRKLRKGLPRKASIAEVLNECANGHPMTSENLYRTPSGARRCRTCNRLRNEAAKERKRGAS